MERGCWRLLLLLLCSGVSTAFVADGRPAAEVMHELTESSASYPSPAHVKLAEFQHAAAGLRLLQKFGAPSESFSVPLILQNHSQYLAGLQESEAASWKKTSKACEAASTHSASALDALKSRIRESQNSIGLKSLRLKKLQQRLSSKLRKRAALVRSLQHGQSPAPTALLAVELRDRFSENGTPPSLIELRRVGSALSSRHSAAAVAAHRRLVALLQLGSANHGSAGSALEPAKASAGQRREIGKQLGALASSLSSPAPSSAAASATPSAASAAAAAGHELTALDTEVGELRGEASDTASDIASTSDSAYDMQRVVAATQRRQVTATVRCERARMAHVKRTLLLQEEADAVARLQRLLVRQRALLAPHLAAIAARMAAEARNRSSAPLLPSATAKSAAEAAEAAKAVQEALGEQLKGSQLVVREEVPLPTGGASGPDDSATLQPRRCAGEDGFTWCGSKARCIRAFQEACPSPAQLLPSPNGDAVLAQDESSVLITADQAAREQRLAKQAEERSKVAAAARARALEAERKKEARKASAAELEAARLKRLAAEAERLANEAVANATLRAAAADEALVAIAARSSELTTNSSLARLAANALLATLQARQAAEGGLRNDTARAAVEGDSHGSALEAASLRAALASREAKAEADAAAAKESRLTGDAKRKGLAAAAALRTLTDATAEDTAAQKALGTIRSEGTASTAVVAAAVARVKASEAARVHAQLAARATEEASQFSSGRAKEAVKAAALLAATVKRLALTESARLAEADSGKARDAEKVEGLKTQLRLAMAQRLEAQRAYEDAEAAARALEARAAEASAALAAAKRADFHAKGDVVLAQAKRAAGEQERLMQKYPVPDQGPLLLQPCGLYSGCVECTANPYCGYLPDKARCVVGTADGPLYLSASDGGGGAWSYASCGGDDCGAYRDCQHCLSAVECGWCGKTLTCSAGGMAGPADVGDCPSAYMFTWAHVERPPGAKTCPIRQHVLTEAAVLQDTARRRALRLTADLADAEAALLGSERQLRHGSTAPAANRSAAEAEVAAERQRVAQLQALRLRAVSDLRAAEVGSLRTYDVGVAQGAADQAFRASQGGTLKALQAEVDRALLRRGPTGATGPDGPPAPRGDTGAAGEDGKAGKPGKTGAAGVDGNDSALEARLAKAGANASAAVADAATEAATAENANAEATEAESRARESTAKIQAEDKAVKEALARLTAGNKTAPGDAEFSANATEEVLGLPGTAEEDLDSATGSGWEDPDHPEVSTKQLAEAGPQGFSRPLEKGAQNADEAAAEKLESPAANTAAAAAAVRAEAAAMQRARGKQNSTRVAFKKAVAALAAATADAATAKAADKKASAAAAAATARSTAAVAAATAAGKALDAATLKATDAASALVAAQKVTSDAAAALAAAADKRVATLQLEMAQLSESKAQTIVDGANAKKAKAQAKADKAEKASAAALAAGSTASAAADAAAATLSARATAVKSAKQLVLRRKAAANRAVKGVATALAAIRKASLKRQQSAEAEQRRKGYALSLSGGAFLNMAPPALPLFSRLAASALTVEVWVKLLSVAKEEGHVVGLVASAPLAPAAAGGALRTQGWVLGVDQYSFTFLLRAVRGGANTTVLRGPLPLAKLHAWYHVAATYDGNVARLFVNGAQMDSSSPGQQAGPVKYPAAAAAATALGGGGQNVTVGWVGGGLGESLEGTVDDVTVWGRVLPPDELLEHAVERGASRQLVRAMATAGNGSLLSLYTFGPGELPGDVVEDGGRHNLTGAVNSALGVSKWVLEPPAGAQLVTKEFKPRVRSLTRQLGPTSLDAVCLASGGGALSSSGGGRCDSLLRVRGFPRNAPRRASDGLPLNATLVQTFRQEQLLLRLHPRLFGPGPTQIPVDGEVQSAKLRLNVETRGSPWRLYPIAQPWEMPSQSGSSGGSDGGAMAFADAPPFLTNASLRFRPSAPGFQQLDITALLRTWARAGGNASTANFGLRVVGEGQRASSVYAPSHHRASLRPQLVVSIVDKQRPPLWFAAGDKSHEEARLECVESHGHLCSVEELAQATAVSGYASCECGWTSTTAALSKAPRPAGGNSSSASGGFDIAFSITRKTSGCAGAPGINYCNDRATAGAYCCKGKPTACVVSEFAPWSTCSATCGPGSQTRARKAVTEPANGGKSCPPLVETRACNDGPCQGDAAPQLRR